MKPVAGGAEGGLLIRVKRSVERVEAVSIRSTRPLGMPQVFAGNSPGQVLATLPLVYSICGRAQGCAAIEAIEQAMGISPRADLWQARRLPVWFETAREHLWRIQLDWAGFLGEAPEREPIRQIVDLMGRFWRALFPDHRHFSLDNHALQADFTRLESLLDELVGLLQTVVYLNPPGEWLQFRGEGDLTCWMEGQDSVAARMLRRVVDQQLVSLGRSGIRALPELDAQDLDRCFLAPDAERFIAQPSWQGAVAETSPFSRQAGHLLVRSAIEALGNGLLPRLIARLVELAMIPQQLAAGIRSMQEESAEQRDRPALAPGVGIAQMEASRGRLIHRVALEGERISRYQILAPTEWNFHPQGVLARGLAGLDVKDPGKFRWQAGLLINTIDPCVGYDLEVV